MGTRGPVPKRSNQRRRTNEPDTAVSNAPASQSVAIPDSDEDWHPTARKWFESLAASGQSAFYEPSDWATAVLIAESMSRDLKPQVVGVIQEGERAGEVVMEVIPLKGASLGAYLRAMSVLLVTEGDRRRASVELLRGETEDPDEDAAVRDLDEYRSRLSS